MVLIQKYNTFMYKEFEADIWGVAFATKHRWEHLSRLFYHMWALKRLNRRCRYEPFYYRLDIINFKPRKRKRKKNVFFALRLVKTYYMTLSYKQFRHLARKAAKLAGDFESNYCSLLEGRLLFILYCSLFFFDIFDLMYFMKVKHVLVNHILIDRYDYLVNTGDFFIFDLSLFFSHCIFLTKKDSLILYLALLFFYSSFLINAGILGFIIFTCFLNFFYSVLC